MRCPLCTSFGSFAAGIWMLSIEWARTYAVFTLWVPLIVAAACTAAMTLRGRNRVVELARLQARERLLECETELARVDG